MIITKKLVNVGNSIGVILDKPILTSLKLSVADYVELDIKKIKIETNQENVI